MGRIRIMLVEDHQVVREGLRRMLELEPDMEVAAEVASGEQALAQVASVSPDIVLMDIKMPGMDGIETTRRLKQVQPECKAIVLTFYEEYLPEAIKAGAAGYLLEDIHKEDLVRAIREVHEGRFPLHLSLDSARVSDAASIVAQPYSERETAILKLVADGMSSRDIAAQLFVSEATVKRTLHQLFDKLGARNRAEAVAEALKRKLI